MRCVIDGIRCSIRWHKFWTVTHDFEWKVWLTWWCSRSAFRMNFFGIEGVSHRLLYALFAYIYSTLIQRVSFDPFLRPELYSASTSTFSGKSVSLSLRSPSVRGTHIYYFASFNLFVFRVFTLSSNLINRLTKVSSPRFSSVYGARVLVAHTKTVHIHIIKFYGRFTVPIAKDNANDKL